ncbi:TPA: hypothetical protein VAP34_002076 [Streptococcus agalactiae]|nr:hypothetical protein [Streptococcus agalactiae]
MFVAVSSSFAGNVVLCDSSHVEKELDFLSRAGDWLGCSAVAVSNGSNVELFWINF